jgi:hypothetical protein
LACRMVMGLVFATSAISKLRGRGAFDEFATTTRLLLVAASPRRLVSDSGSRRVGGAVIAAEASVPLLLLVPGLSRFGLGVAMFLLTLFGLGIVVAMRRRVRTTCRCFGASSTPLGKRHLIRNTILFVVAAAGLGAGPAGHADLAALAVVAGSAVVAAVLVVRFDDVIELFAPSLPTGRT